MAQRRLSRTLAALGGLAFALLQSTTGVAAPLDAASPGYEQREPLTVTAPAPVMVELGDAIQAARGTVVDVQDDQFLLDLGGAEQMWVQPTGGLELPQVGSRVIVSGSPPLGAVFLADRITTLNTAS